VIPVQGSNVIDFENTPMEIRDLFYILVFNLSNKIRGAPRSSEFLFG
jgi:hypothetical protein